MARGWVPRNFFYLLTIFRLFDSQVQGGPKMAQFLLNPLTLSNIDRISKFFYCQNQEKICNNIITKDPTTPEVCCYTTLWNVSVLTATIENKTTSATTYFQKVATGYNVFILSTCSRWRSTTWHPCKMPALLLDTAYLQNYLSYRDFKFGMRLCMGMRSRRTNNFPWKWA